MILARDDGVIVATDCHPSMTGHRTIICHPLDDQGREEGAPILALDPYAAGQHQRVLVSSDGSQTRLHVKDPKSPLRNIVLGVIDDDDEKAGH